MEALPLIRDPFDDLDENTFPNLQTRGDSGPTIGTNNTVVIEEF